MLAREGKLKEEEKENWYQNHEISLMLSKVINDQICDGTLGKICRGRNSARIRESIRPKIHVIIQQRESSSDSP